MLYAGAFTLSFPTFMMWLKRKSYVIQTTEDRREWWAFSSLMPKLASLFLLLCYPLQWMGVTTSYRLSVQRNELISPLGCHENFPKEIGKAHKYSRTYNEPNRDVTEWPAKNMTDEIWTWSERKNPMGLKFPWWGIKFPRKFNKRQTRVLCYASPRI